MITTSSSIQKGKQSRNDLNEMSHSDNVVTESERDSLTFLENKEKEWVEHHSVVTDYERNYYMRFL